ncbi:MAG: hypothetical protein H0A76_00945 [Candidatus Thiodubiliella endoseptemdiera]|uniref:Uncharacterized protein n=1 Tax=Candidatus Thiodubiliella endoseptemdiera TaxID=2738886 RepID=A0A853F452_9GAMM|nr:hypothetical protein [Candidatus Thiodubiliella endoseptemdiera]
MQLLMQMAQRVDHLLLLLPMDGILILRMVFTAIMVQQPGIYITNARS